MWILWANCQAFDQTDKHCLPVMRLQDWSLFTLNVQEERSITKKDAPVMGGENEKVAGSEQI